jgi:NADH-ubiquinone oxidoreductase chain 2
MMLLVSFLIFLVSSSYNSYNKNNFLSPVIGHSILYSRIVILLIIFTLFTYVSTFDLIGITPNITLYNDWFKISSSSLVTSLLIGLFTIAILIYDTSTNKYDNKSLYYALLIPANLIGLLLFPMVNDLLALYIVVELQSYSLYLLTGVNNRSYNASRAGLLYFLMGGIASTIILVSSYYLYAYTGSTNLSDINLISNMDSSSNIKDYSNILLIALLFKMGLAPFHRWSIAVYNYAPTFITAYISLVAKLSIASFIMVNISLFDYNILLIVYFLSIFIGSYKPLFQVNIKAIFAYSGLLNFGYLLLGIVTYDISFYIFLIQYTITHTLIFLVLLVAGNQLSRPITKWSPLLYIHQLYIPEATLAAIMILSLFSLIGIPPFPGFYGKLYILIGALQNNYILEVISLVICSVVSTYYYANIIKVVMTSDHQVYYKGCSEAVGLLISSLFILLMIFFIALPSLLEGLYLIII